VCFKQGSLIAKFNGIETSQDGNHVLWVEDKITKEVQAHLGTGMLKYLNHSNVPNCEFNGLELFALKDILVSDELCFHYGEDWVDIP
tara:strand:+ start:688 stop:948 length:261 start_codon:yes stop_codon:yes gene_type:complete